jgi:hypothetical protein
VGESELVEEKGRKEEKQPEDQSEARAAKPKIR